ncbi:meprin A subunit alpha-like isoform X3 [Mobula hypostoma]|uniref:meprin A subunit alpha-like isoform X3 n=1 Tax=Mobula hypostoma TaxID=723540 RepID=UPI002FC3DD73
MKLLLEERTLDYCTHLPRGVDLCPKHAINVKIVKTECYCVHISTANAFADWNKMHSSALYSFSLVVLLAYCETLVIRKGPFENYYEVDVSNLKEDIPQINAESQRFLLQGHIEVVREWNARKDPTTRWKFPIPYILTDSLELNAKGIILDVFEQFRLKSCIDFKPYEGEKSFLSFKKLYGCWSFIGNNHNGQVLSIGQNCDSKPLVEHKILHALGFYHERSKPDRYNYVNIRWNEIQPGDEIGFKVYGDDIITDQNTPYDYESLMHYPQFSFTKNNSVRTITAKIPAFNDIIGQRLDFSALDLLRLNRMYKCNATLTLLDQCAFEFLNICGMIQGEQDATDWVHVKNSPGNEDHTISGKCRGIQEIDASEKDCDNFPTNKASLKILHNQGESRFERDF